MTAATEAAIETMACHIEREALGEAQFQADIGAIPAAEIIAIAIAASARAAIRLAARDAVNRRR